MILKQSRTIRITPQTGLGLPDIWEVWRYKDLLWRMIISSIKSKYRQSALGVSWAIIQPAVSTGLFTIIFGIIAGFSAGDTPYPLFIFAALSPWLFFNKVVIDGNSSLVALGGVLSKVYVPRLLILLVPIGAAFLDFAIGQLILVGLLIYFKIVPTWAVVFAPLFLLMFTLFAVSLTAWLSVINVTYRDVTAVLPFSLQMLFYASPIVYPLSQIPEHWQWLYWLNPVAVILEGFRWSLLAGPAPSILQVGLALLQILIILIPGLVFFDKLSRTLADRL